MADNSCPIVGASALVFPFDSHTVRAMLRDGDPWFVAADVCAALELGNPSMALRRLDADEQALSSIEGISRGNDQVNLINESGLYSLVLGCRKPEAKRFKRWVTAEVLPAIRKTGQYVNSSADTAVAPAPELTPLWPGLGQVEFAGNIFHMVLISGEPYASVREVCRAVGVDAQGQVTRLKADEAYWRLRVATFPTDGGPQASCAIPAGMVSNWLKSIKHPRVSATARFSAAVHADGLGPRMLAHWWANEGSPANQTPLSDPEVKELDLVLEEGAQLMRTAGEQALFPAQARLLLAEEFGVSSYRDIPCSKFHKALAWITRHTLAVAAAPFKTSQATAGAKRWIFSLDEDGNEHFQRLTADVTHEPWPELVAGVEAGQRQFDEVLGMFQACGKFLQARALALPAPLGTQAQLNLTA